MCQEIQHILLKDDLLKVSTYTIEAEIVYVLMWR